MRDYGKDEPNKTEDQRNVTILGERRSSVCRRTERLLGRKGYRFEVVDVTGNDGLRVGLPETAGKKAGVLVFVDGRPVGGLGEIKALDRSGDLDRLVRGEV